MTLLYKIRSAIPKESMPIIIPQVITPKKIAAVDFKTLSCISVAIRFREGEGRQMQKDR